MTEPRPFRFADLLLVLLVVAAAGGARAWYLSACADGGQGPGPFAVQGSSPAPGEETLLTRLREENSFTGRAPLGTTEERTAHVAPGYPWLRAAVARVTTDEAWAWRWGQAALGALTAGLYVLFARQAFGHRLVALLAGLLCAFYPFWIVNVTEVGDGALTSFLLALALWLGARCGQAGGAFGSLLYGLSLAALALVRAALLPFAFVAELWYLARCRSLPRGWLYALLAFLGFANGLVPWVVRNFQATGDVVPIVDTLYLHLWMGNNPRATGSELTEADLLSALAESRGEERTALAERLAALPQTERYGHLAGDVVAEVSRSPEAVLRQRLFAGSAFLLSGKWSADRRPWQDTGTTTAPPWLLDLMPALFYGALLLILVLGVVGWRGTHAWRERAMPSSLALVWVALPYLLTHAEMLHGPRLPLDGVLLTYAAFAVVSVLPRVGQGLWQGREGEAE